MLIGRAGWNPRENLAHGAEIVRGLSQRVKNKVKKISPMHEIKEEYA